MKCQRIGCNGEAKYLLEMTTKTYRPLDVQKLWELRVEVYLCELHYLSCFPDGKVRKQEILKDAKEISKDNEFPTRMGMNRGDKPLYDEPKDNNLIIR